MRAKYGDEDCKMRLCALYRVPWHMMVKSAVSSFKASFVPLVLGLDGLRGMASAHGVGSASPWVGVVGSVFEVMGRYLKMFIVVELGRWDEEY